MSLAFPKFDPEICAACHH